MVIQLMRCINCTREPEVCRGQEVALCLTLGVDMCEAHHVNLHGEAYPILEKDGVGDRRFDCFSPVR